MAVGTAVLSGEYFKTLTIPQKTKPAKKRAEAVETQNFASLPRICSVMSVRVSMSASSWGKDLSSEGVFGFIRRKFRTTNCEICVKRP